MSLYLEDDETGIRVNNPKAVLFMWEGKDGDCHLKIRAGQGEDTDFRNLWMFALNACLHAIMTAYGDMELHPLRMEGETGTVAA